MDVLDKAISSLTKQKKQMNDNTMMDHHMATQSAGFAIAVSEAFKKLKAELDDMLAKAIVVVTKTPRKTEVISPVTIANFPRVQKVQVTNQDGDNADREMVRKLDALNRSLSSLAVTVKNPADFTNVEMAIHDLSKTFMSSIKHKEDPKHASHMKMMVEKLDKLIESVDKMNREQVIISNMSDFPVALPYVAFRDVNGGATSVRLTAGGALPVSVSTGDPLAEYKISNKDDDGEPNYYGYIKEDGSWYILKEESSTYRYAAGSTDFPTNWTNRAGLTYDYYSNVF